MTGEPDPVVKMCISKCLERREEILKHNNGNSVSRHEIPTPILMSGTNIIEGDGLMLCVVVGPNSTQGKIDEILKT
jgi:magnesium-transporting ATPase (P-type)